MKLSETQTSIASLSQAPLRCSVDILQEVAIASENPSHWSCSDDTPLVGQEVDLAVCYYLILTFPLEVPHFFWLLLFLAIEAWTSIIARHLDPLVYSPQVVSQTAPSPTVSTVEKSSSSICGDADDEIAVQSSERNWRFWPWVPCCLLFPRLLAFEI